MTVDRMVKRPKLAKANIGEESQTEGFPFPSSIRMKAIGKQRSKSKTSESNVVMIHSICAPSIGTDVVRQE